MTLTPPTRKRTRSSCEEEEFLPLSKKINNLHINNWVKLNSSPQEPLFKCHDGSSDQFIDLYSSPEEYLLNRRRALPPNELRNGTVANSFKNGHPQESSYETVSFQSFKDFNNDSHRNYNCLNGETNEEANNEQRNWSLVYNPDLDVNENPYYYESNKLLFHLYVERLQRNGY